MEARDRNLIGPVRWQSRACAAAPALWAVVAATVVCAGCELDVTPRAVRPWAAIGTAGAGADAGHIEAGSDPLDLPDARPPADDADADADVHGDADTGEPATTRPAPAADAAATNPQDAAIAQAHACADGELRVAPCGLNDRGEQKQVCAEGAFADDGACSDPDVCADDAGRAIACGANGNGSQAQLCVAGQWQNEAACDDADACANGATRHVECGRNANGTLAQRCTSGEWQDDGVCGDPDVCVEGDRRTATCGLNGTGARPQRCASGQWQDDGACADQDVCANGATRSVTCGVLGGGTRPQRCSAGQWQNEGVCADPDWTCDPTYYGTRDGCDCACGSHDPDCYVPDQPVLNCEASQFCNAQGACQNVPVAWTCTGSYYASLDGCDCECGALDPDCAVPGQAVYGCESGQSCNGTGMCEL
jgi:hypothetical protein